MSWCPSSSLESPLDSLSLSSVSWVRLNPRLLALRDVVRQTHQATLEARAMVNEAEFVLKTVEEKEKKEDEDVEQQLEQLEILNQNAKEEEKVAVEAFLAEREAQRLKEQAEAEKASASSAASTASKSEEGSSLETTSCAAEVNETSGAISATQAANATTESRKESVDVTNSADRKDESVLEMIKKFENQSFKFNGIKECINRPGVSDSKSQTEGSNPPVESKSESSLEKIFNPNSINLSEFEGESDPFTSMELKTINELQELASVLQINSSTNSVPNVIPNHQVNATVPQQVHQPSFSSNVRSPVHNAHHISTQGVRGAGARAASGPSNVPFNHLTSSHGGAFNSGYAPAMMNPSYIYQSPSQHPNHVFTNWPQPTLSWASTTVTKATTTMTETPVKGSKSIGDLVSEVENDAHSDVPLPSHREHSMKNAKPVSVTPPPNLVSNSGSSKEEWIPWPTLEEPSKKVESKLLRQMIDMGFPKPRVLRVIEAVGEEPSKIVNACLMIEKLCAENLPEKDVTHFVLQVKPDTTEDKARKHLRNFVKLGRLGFPKEKIHQALVHCDCDHDKALEELLK